MNVCIKIIPHKEQRYKTVGDWFYDDDGIQIRVSRMGEWRYEMLVAVHELVEILLCRHAGITQDSVDKFDMAFEDKRKPDNNDEPGDEPDAPYNTQHCIATGVERILAALLLVSWKEYDIKISSL